MKQKLIMIGWDGADWEIARPLMDGGKMPQLQELVTNGTSGNLRSSPPYLSPMLWNTMATGKSPAEHGITGFREFNPSTQSHQPISSTSRNTKAIWNMLSQEGWNTHVVGWFATYPAESIKGVVISDLYAHLSDTDKKQAALPGMVSPEAKSDDLLSLRVAPEDIDPGLLKFFIPEISEINLERDKRPLALRKRLAELYSYHNAAVVLLQEEATDFLTVYYHFIDWICHDFMELAPPQRAGVCDRDYELYSGVIDAAYVLQDLLLRDLLRHAGTDFNCLIVSDHGFLSGDERPQATANVDGGIAGWHRIDGIIAGAGPLFNKGKTGIRASLFDLAPTLLHALGLPVGADMPGHIIEGLLSKDTAVATIPSWDARGAPHEKVEAQALSSTASEELLKQFADLGYVSAEDERKEVAEAKTHRENAWNLGMALIGETRYAEALAYLEEAYFYNREASHKALHLMNCQIELGLIEESLQTQESLLDYGPRNGKLAYHLGIAARKREDYGTALSLLEEADAFGGNRHDNALERGLIFLLQSRFQESEALFRKETELHTTPSAQLGLCRALVMLEQFDEAEIRLLNLMEKQPTFSIGWFTLGIIYEKRSDFEKAKAAYGKAIKWRPEFKQAHGRKFMLERKALEESGQFRPLVFNDLDFREPPTEKEARERVERIALIREASRNRHIRWEKEQTYRRNVETPISVLNRSPQKKENKKTIVIVSGLPRAGTSLMMQMLASGGMDLQVDDSREPNAHNPRGFFEWEPVIRLAENGARLSEAVDKAVKVVSSQLSFLPTCYAYKIIWMDRPVSEVACSQAKMMSSQEASLDAAYQNETMLEAHRDQVLQALRQYNQDELSDLSLLEVDYADCIYQTDSISANLAGFLQDLLPQPEQIGQAVDPSLYRNRLRKEKSDV